MTRHSIILIVLGLCVAWVSGASNMVFKKVEVNMGNVGSDDDMRIKICDKSKCCTTKVLSHLLKSEWVAKKKEIWDGSDLGNCSSILFDENLSSIEVALLKDGKKNGPEVNSMKLTGQIGSDKKKTTAFNCGQYKFTAKDTIKSNFCTKDSTSSANRGTPTTSRTTTRSSSSSRTTPNMAFKKIVVQMGAVGSDDDMRLRICDTSKCCTTKKLSHLLSSEWVAKKKETWDGSDLGNCSSILFDQNLSSVEVAILKNGVKSAPEITSMEVTGQIGSDKKKTQVYKCGSYKFSKNDAQETNFCLKGSSSSANRATTTAKPKPTTKRPSSSSSTPSMVFKKVVVQMGAVGSDDDMSLKICDPSKCCTTKKLSHLLSSEWVAKKKETWDGSDLGNCSSILFDQHLSSVEVAILKNGKKSAPEITSMEVSGQVGSDKKNIQVFKCGSYKFTKTDAQKTSFCLNNKAPPKPTTRPSSPSSTPGTHQVNNVIVQVGNDGSNDEISLDICNEKSALSCCNTGALDKSLSDDWSKNDKETWEKKRLGACKTTSFDPCKGFDVAIKKKSGKDSLKVSSITLELQKPTENTPSAKFVCKDYVVGASDTIIKRSCSLDSTSSKLSCPKTPPGGSRLPTPAPRPSSVTNKPPTSPPRSPVSPSGPCLRSGKNCEEAVVTITSFEVQTAADGTEDPITAGVCSDTNDVDVCCQTGDLKKAGTNGWARNKKETWPLITLGRCAGEKFPIQATTTTTNLNQASLELSLNKRGSNKLELSEFIINAEDAKGAKRQFKCGRISVDKPKVTTTCFARYPKAATRTTKRPSRSTTRPPFRSGSG